MSNEVDYSPIKYLGNGITIDFPFDWKVFNDADLIVTLIDSEGNKSTLELGIDYLVQIEAMGGNVKTTTPPLFGTKIIVSRKTPNYQSTGYSTSTGFQGTEIEKSFDKVSCNLQEMDYNIETFKTEFSSETNQKIEDFKENVDSQIYENKADTDRQILDLTTSLNTQLDENQRANEQAIQDFKDDVNEVIEDVREAAELIDTTIASVNEAVETCTQKAGEATAAINTINANVSVALGEFEDKIEEATAQAGIATTKAEEASEKVDGAIQNIQVEGQAQVAKVQSTGFYMREGKLYYIEDGEEKEFKSGVSDVETPLDIDTETGALVLNKDNTLNVDAGGYLGVNPNILDGQWVAVSNDLIISQAKTVGNYTISLDSWLPQDGAQYEILLNAYIFSTLTAPLFTAYYLKSTPLNWGCGLEAANKNGTSFSNIIIPVGSDHELQLTVDGTNDANGIFTLYFVAYRKLGMR